MTDFEALVNAAAEKAVPPNYIDPEHQGQDRELLEAFYQACRAEGGTADEIHLRGIKAALATLQTALPGPSAPSEDWAAVAAFAQDMRARGLAEQAHGDELLKLANQRAALRVCGVAPSNPAPLPTKEEILTWLQFKDDATAYWADDVPAFILEALKLWGQVAPTSAQPAAIAQPAEGPSPVAPDHASLIAFAHGREPWATWLKRGGCLESAHCELSDLMLAVLARYGRPTFQPIPVSERLPGPDDCTPWPDTTTISWYWAATDHDGEWGWNQYSIGPSDFNDNLSRIMRGRGYTHWAPWWAFPLPGGHSSGATEEAEKVKP